MQTEAALEIFFERMRRVIASHTNLGTVSKATLRKPLRGRVELIWTFPNA